MSDRTEKNKLMSIILLLLMVLSGCGRQNEASEATEPVIDTAAVNEVKPAMRYEFDNVFLDCPPNLGIIVINIRTFSNGAQ